MIVFLVLLLILAVFRVKFAGKGFYLNDYISREQTLCINGIFMAYILLSHTFNVYSSPGILNETFGVIKIYLGQFPVVPILFFSGYGIMESVKHKEGYIKNFPKQRLLKFYYKFFLISLIYVVLNLFLREYDLTTVLLSFTGFESIGNGGWYIGVTLFVYILVIICFNIFKTNYTLAAAVITILTAALMLVEMKLDLPTYYYSTMIFMPLGLCFSLIKDKFDAIIMKNNIVWSVSLISSLAFSVIFNILADRIFIFYPVWCFFGLVALMVLCMKVRINNIVLLWLGQTAIYNFVLQRIPHKLFSLLNISDMTFYLLSFIATFALIVVADKLFKPIDKLFKAK